MARLEIEKGNPVELSLIPVEQSDDFHVSLIEKEQKNKVLAKIHNYRNCIEDENKLYDEWIRFINSRSKMINTFSPVSSLRNKYIRAIFRRLGIEKKLINKNNLKTILNYFRCEAHRDVILQLLKKQLEEE
ncbi:MAG: hypothetical protein ACOCWG_00015 [bacterium]